MPTTRHRHRNVGRPDNERNSLHPDGTCACAAGQARLAAYQHSLTEAGLPS